MSCEGAIWKTKQSALLLIPQIVAAFQGFWVRSQSGLSAILIGLLILVNQRWLGLSILDFIDWWGAEFAPAQHDNRSNSTRDKPVPQPFAVTRKNILHGADY